MIKRLTILIMILSVLLISSCSTEDSIQKQIDEANFCSVDSDCTYAGSKCPFGCYVYVNKAESEKITKLIDSFDSKCIYDCMVFENVTCIKGKCIVNGLPN